MYTAAAVNLYKPEGWPRQFLLQLVSDLTSNFIWPLFIIILFKPKTKTMVIIDNFCYVLSAKKNVFFFCEWMKADKKIDFCSISLVRWLWCNACRMKKGNKRFWRARNQNFVFKPFIFSLKNNKFWSAWGLERTSTRLITVFYHYTNDRLGHF